MRFMIQNKIHENTEAYAAGVREARNTDGQRHVPDPQVIHKEEWFAGYDSGKVWDHFLADGSDALLREDVSMVIFVEQGGHRFVALADKITERDADRTRDLSQTYGW